MEVHYNSTWGTVCDDFWSNADANVVCRQLGFSGASTRYSAAYFGQGEGPIWLDNLQCIGTETSIFDCTHAGLGIHNCQHTDDAGVECTSKLELQ